MPITGDGPFSECFSPGGFDEGEGTPSLLKQALDSGRAQALPGVVLRSCPQR